MVGPIAQPISGGLDFASSAFEGMDATQDQLIGRPSAGTTNRRLRLPRAIGGDGKVTAFLGSDGTEKEVGQPYKDHATPTDTWNRLTACWREHFAMHLLILRASPSDFWLLCVQARVEKVGQALLRRTQDAGGVGTRRKGKRSRFHMDAYEEHMLLPEVSLLLCCLLRCVLRAGCQALSAAWHCAAC